VRSSIFDDDSTEDLCVFGGDDLLTAHLDHADLDWGELAERAALDERRGLVIAQVAVLEDLVDEFILYLRDPADPEQAQLELDKQTIGPRLETWRQLLDGGALLDREAADLLESADAVVRRRNELAHGVLFRRPTRVVPIAEIRNGVDVEWILTSRRSRQPDRITMCGLRADLNEAIATFSAMLAFAEHLAAVAPRPRNYGGGTYVTVPAE
jgi:hypothetical protein